MRSVRIAAAQTPDIREDVDAALLWALETAARADAEDAALLCFPEGFLQGYLTDEAQARANALDRAAGRFAEVMTRLKAIRAAVVIGMIEADGERLFNTAIVVQQGVVVGSYRKVHLLRSERAFEPGAGGAVFEVAGLRFGVNICYDTNFADSARELADLGASLIVCPANNMLPRQTAEDCKDMHNAVRGERCRETGLWLVSADVTGERDGRISWGPTAVLNPAGEVVAQLPLDAPGLLLFDLPVA